MSAKSDLKNAKVIAFTSQYGFESVGYRSKPTDSYFNVTVYYADGDYGNVPYTPKMLGGIPISNLRVLEEFPTPNILELIGDADLVTIDTCAEDGKVHMFRRNKAAGDKWLDAGRMMAVLLESPNPVINIYYKDMEVVKDDTK